MIAALYDVHGNAVALESVIAELRRLDVDLVVSGGDVVEGPEPHRALSLLRDLPFPTVYVRGNTDREIVGNDQRAKSAWTRANLDQEEIQFLATFQQSVRAQMNGDDIIFCHSTPEEDNCFFTPQSSSERLEAIFNRTRADLLVCGHTHMQYSMQVGPLRVVNAGSVGRPVGEPRAQWLVVRSGVAELRSTEYDLQRAVAVCRRSGHPAAETLASEIAKPFSFEESIRFFERLASARSM